MRKAAPPREIPPPLELDCLRVLWRLGEARVRDVQTALFENRELKYTTVMTVLGRLTRRGAVSRRKDGRSFVYAPELSEDALRKLAVQEVVDRYFGGSKPQLMKFMATREDE
ncbi:MAG TPA: BlaI/MecI/CopY family transcriptional regulator [Bryobacteraceae bacterium]|nr:BlaI/MecI/CopY family transcriptional regulator [Bryobacteraceae bacterium]